MISDWAVQFRIKVVPCEERPDKPAGDVVYRIKDIFTTRDGSWEPSSVPGSVPQWARDKYLRPWGAEDYFDDAGGDHGLFARVLDLDGKPITTQDLIIGWSDGFQLLGQPDFASHINLTMTPKERSGWANQPIWNSYVPERGETGAWCWCPRGAADVVVGGGMPSNWHVSFFAVWQAEPRQIVTPPVTGGGVITAPVTDFETLRQAVWSAAGMTFNRDSALANYARVHNLGAPLTNEVELGGYQAQGFAGGIVYAPHAQWENITHMPW